MRTNGIRNFYAVIFFDCDMAVRRNYCLPKVISAAFCIKYRFNPWWNMFLPSVSYSVSNIIALIVLKLNLLLFMKALKISCSCESKINFLKILGKYKQIRDWLLNYWDWNGIPFIDTRLSSLCIYHGDLASNSIENSLNRTGNRQNSSWWKSMSI